MFVHAPVLGFGLQVVSGTGMIIVDVLAITALQRDLPRGVLGRVLSLLDAAVLLAILASSFLFAFVLRAVDLHATLFILGVGFPATALLGIRPLVRADRRAVARLRELEPRIMLLQVLDLFAASTRGARSSASPAPSKWSRSPPAPRWCARASPQTRCGCWWRARSMSRRLAR